VNVISNYNNVDFFHVFVEKLIRKFIYYQIAHTSRPCTYQ